MHATLARGKWLVSANLASSAEGKQILSGISHIVSCPRPAWVFLVIFFLLHRFASRFSSPPSVFFRRHGALVGSPAGNPRFDVLQGDSADGQPPGKTRQGPDVPHIAVPGAGLDAGPDQVDPALRRPADQVALRVVLRERQVPPFAGGDPADLAAQVLHPSSRQFLVDRVQAAAYLLAVSFEDGIVDSGVVGTVQIVPDSRQRLLSAAFGTSGAHGKSYRNGRRNRRVTSSGDNQFEKAA